MLKQPWLRASLVVVALFVLAAVTRESPQARRATPVYVYPTAANTYTRAAYPEYFATWGEAGIERINRARRAAAKIVSYDEKCDKVAAADLSTRAKPPLIVIFVLCDNMYKVYFTEAEALAGAK